MKPNVRVAYRVSAWTALKYDRDSRRHSPGPACLVTRANGFDVETPLTDRHARIPTDGLRTARTKRDVVSLAPMDPHGSRLQVCRCSIHAPAPLVLSRGRFSDANLRR